MSGKPGNHLPSSSRAQVTSILPAAPLSCVARALLGLAPLKCGRHAPWVVCAGPESQAKQATQDSISWRGECGRFPQACRIVIPFPQFRGPRKVEDESNSPGKENNPALSLTYILVPGTMDVAI